MRRMFYLFMLAVRLLWPQRSWMRVVALVCMLGVALGTMLQIVVRGVMDGMVEEIDAGVSACVPPLLVKSASLRAADVVEVEGIAVCEDVAMGMGLLNGTACKYATWGNLMRIDSYLMQGDMPRTAHEALLSKVCAEAHGVQVGEQVVLCTQAGDMLTLKVCGIYRVPGRMLVPDLIMDAPLRGESLLAVKPVDGVSVELVMARISAIDATAQRVDGSGDTDGWLNLIAKVKRVMGIILYLVVLIAAFATGGMVFVICLSHRRAVAVMRAFGATPQQTCLVFLFQGTIIASIGSCMGLLFGFLILEYRMQVQGALRWCGVDAFPTQVLDMELPALAPASLYITQGVAAWCMVMMSALIGAVSASRFCRLR